MSKIFSFKTIIIIFSCIGSFLVILATLNYGPGLSPDSIEYLAAANNLVHGLGFLSYNGLPIYEWPPLYPVIIFLSSFSLGVSTLISAVILNALLFGLIIYRSGLILYKYLNNKTIVIVGLLAVLFSIPVFTEALWAHSELLFIFLLILYIDYLISYIEKGNLISFTILVILTSFALLTRYIGITMVLTTIITILIYSKKEKSKKILSILFYTVLSGIPIGIWIIRNYIISNTFFGERGTSRYSFFLNIYLTIDKILSWDISDHFINLKVFFIIFILIAALVLILLMVKKIRVKDLYLTINKRITVILILFISGYLLTLILISSIKAHNPIDSRLLSPVYIPGLILLLIILQACYNRIKSFKNVKLLKIVFFSILILSGVEPILHTIKMINYHYNNGEGYSGRLWEKENKKNWLISIKKNYIKNSAMYSNEPFEVYYLLNNYAKWSPRKTFYDSEQIYIHLNDLNGVWPSEKRGYLVWFNQIEFHSTSLYTIRELKTVSDLKMIDSSDVGTLYSVEIKIE